MEKKKREKKKEKGVRGGDSWEEWDLEEMGIDLTDGECMREGR